MPVNAASRNIRLIGSAAFMAIAIVTIEAGGWVVITVTDVPEYVVAGQPVTLTYGVRQHGRHLLDGLAGMIEARAGNSMVRAASTPAAEPGHYFARITLPHPGEWSIDILSGFSGSLNASRMTLIAIDERQPPPARTDAERGKQLFLAKGCHTCHRHDGVEGRSTGAGKNLTTKRYEPEYLTRFLAHPPQREPYVAGEWQMPDLKLREIEIAPLVAFLNSGAPSAAQR
jgi:mono/diheme cytochrome c family protein